MEYVIAFAVARWSGLYVLILRHVAVGSARRADLSKQLYAAREFVILH
jgi:hypothetical protein